MVAHVLRCEEHPEGQRVEEVTRLQEARCGPQHEAGTRFEEGAHGAPLGHRIGAESALRHEGAKGGEVGATRVSLPQRCEASVDVPPGLGLLGGVIDARERPAVSIAPGQAVDFCAPLAVALVGESRVVGLQRAARIERVVGHQVQFGDVPRKPRHFLVVEHHDVDGRARKVGDRAIKGRIAAPTLAVDVEVEGGTVPGSRLDVRQVDPVAGKRPQRRLQGTRAILELDQEGGATFSVVRVGCHRVLRSRVDCAPAAKVSEGPPNL